MTANASRYNKNLALRFLGYWTGTRQRVTASEETNSASDLIARNNHDALRGNLDKLSEYTEPDAIGPAADNPDVWKRRFFKGGITKLKRIYRFILRTFRNFFAFVALFRSSKFTLREKAIMLYRLRRWDEEELEEDRRAQSEEALHRLHKEQAKIVKDRLIEQLTQMRFCHHVTKNERVYIKKRMQVILVDINPFTYTYHFKLPGPFGVNVYDITAPDKTNILASSLGRSLSVVLDKDGLRIIVQIASRLSIPTFATYKEMIDRMPKKLPLLSYPAGMSVNGALVYGNLDTGPHLLIGGQSRGGKSNAQNAIICTFISRNNPFQLRCIFIDLKGGVEFTFYEGIPHLQPMNDSSGWESNGIVEAEEDVPHALDWIIKECRSRNLLLKKSGYKSVTDYNRRKHIQKRKPIIVVFFDEYAMVKYSEYGKETEKALTVLGNIGRASGIHVVLCTQKPGADIVNTNIVVNFMQRLAFNMTQGGSTSMVGSWDAYNLSPAGRAIFVKNGENIPVQFPRITDSTIRAIVNGAKEGNVDISGMMSIDAEEVLKWSLDNAGGKLDMERLHNQFKEKISRNNLREIVQSLDNQVYEIGGAFYRVMPPAGTRGRYMELDDADYDGRSDIEPADGQRPTIENAENLPESAPIVEEEPEPAKLPVRTCAACGAQVFLDPCEYCGIYVEDKKED